MKMNKKLFLAGIIGAALIFGIMVIGCDNDPGDDEDKDPKAIVITGITGIDEGEASVIVQSAYNGRVNARAKGTIEDGSLAVELKLPADTGKEPTATDWTGTGSFYIVLQTDGVSLITKEKISISGQITEISFDNFEDWD
jgi:hypothetical protein